MHENIRLTKRDTWMARIWQMLGDLDEAITRAETKIRRLQNNENENVLWCCAHISVATTNAARHH